MKKKRQITYRLFLIPMMCLLAGACTSDNALQPDTPKVDGPVSFSAQFDNSAMGNNIQINTRVEPGDQQSDYLNLHFVDGDRIRIANTLRTEQTPNFINGNYYEYVRGEEVWNDGQYYVKYAFNPYNQNGFRWSDLKLNGNTYVLEAAFYPVGYDPAFFDGNTVPQEQNTPEILKKSDLLLSHHLKHFTEWGNEIELKFRHVFSLVYTSLTVPIYDQVTGTGFLRPNSDEDHPKGCLTKLRTHYSMNYRASISTDGIISVRADHEKPLIDEIVMCPASYTIDEDKQEITYNYLVIIPTQAIDYTGTLPLHRFYLKDKDGNIKRYRFIPRDTPIVLEQGKMTQISLTLPRNSTDAILVCASIAPWTQAYAELILEEKK